MQSFSVDKELTLIIYLFIYLFSLFYEKNIKRFYHVALSKYKKVHWSKLIIEHIIFRLVQEVKFCRTKF